MNNIGKSNLKQRDSEAIWDIFCAAKSEFDEMAARSLTLQQELNDLRQKARAKARLLEALQDALKAEAEDALPESVLQRVNLPLVTDRVTSAHAIVKRYLQARKTDFVEASEVVKSPEVLNIGIEPKAIYNVLNYLAQKGDLKKIERGKYLIPSAGVGVESSAEIACNNGIERE